MLLIINQRRKESLPANSKHSAEGSLLLEAKALNATSHNSKKVVYYLNILTFIMGDT